MTSQERKEKRYYRRKESRKSNKTKITEFNGYELDELLQSYRESISGDKKNKRSSIKFTDKGALLQLYEISSSTNPIYKSHGLYDIHIETRGRIRDIQAPHKEERIVQKCFVDNYLFDILKSSLLPENIGNVKNRGTVFAINKLKKDLSQVFRKYGREAYICLMDYEKYFDTIDPKIALQIVAKNTENILIIKQIEEFCRNSTKGLPFGSPVSQWLAVVYPNEIDHFIKEKCHIKWFERYVDDSYMIDQSDEYLRDVLSRVSKKASNIGLSFNQKKTKICKIKDFTYLKVHFHISKKGKITTSITGDKIRSIKKKFKRMKERYINKEISFSKIQKVYESTMDYLNNYGSRQNKEEIVGFYKKLFGGAK